MLGVGRKNEDRVRHEDEEHELRDDGAEFFFFFFD